MSDVVALEFADPAGDPFRIEWRAEALASLALPQPDAEPPWTLGGELDWGEVDGLRIVSARLGADFLLALAAVRPRDAGGHGDELVAGALGDALEFHQLDESLISTEYGPDGAVRRIGLELYRDADGLPIRVAGDVVAATADQRGRVRRESATFELRSAGEQGIGILDVLSAG